MALRTTSWASWAAYRAEEQQTAQLSSGGDLPTAFFFPADYAVGMANLGYHYIYRALRDHGVAVERFFSTPIPYRSVERDTLFERFGLVMASISYEGDVPIFAKWLADGGVSPSREGRDGGGAPIIGVGGAITYINPLSLSGIADFIVLGDGLPVIAFLVDALRRGDNRESTLRALAEHPSILVPVFHLEGKCAATQSDLQISRQLDITKDYGYGTWVTPHTVFGATLLVELQRGCVRGCNYCTIPSCFTPFRQRDVEVVRADIERIASVCDFEQVGLVTPEASDFRGLDGLLDAIASLGKNVSFASLRVDGLTEHIINTLVQGGRRSVTIAPETGNDALRVKCGKRFSNERIAETLAMAKSRGITGAKMYFMLGLPGETDEDVIAIAALCRVLREQTGLRLTASVSPFVPKPGTPWQSAPFAGSRVAKKKFALLTRAMGKNPGVTLQTMSVREAELEYALSWASSGFSKKLAESVRNNASYKRLFAETDRVETMRELARLGLVSEQYQQDTAF